MTLCVCCPDLQEFPCLGGHIDDVRGIEFKEGDIVQVLDTEKAEEWLVRKAADHEQVLNKNNNGTSIILNIFTSVQIIDYFVSSPVCV